MKRLSCSIGDIETQYDVVVIGSGYGGGIAAARLSRAGQKVCVLERGREILPGEFPRTLAEARRELQVDLNGFHINSGSALYDLRINDDVNVFVGCGLGGTSLINANVAAFPDDRVFETSRWPKALRSDLIGLQNGRKRAECMFNPAIYPNTEPVLLKLSALRAAAEHAKLPFVQPHINVNFRPKHVNPAGVEQPCCKLCGDCTSGCNLGAKTTVHLTYLADAEAHGAKIFTEVTARYIEPVGPPWRVHYTLTDLPVDVFGGEDLIVCAKHVVLAAGTLGSTEILLRSRDRGLAVSDRLGQGFSTNADVLAFGFNNDVPISAVGLGEPPRGSGRVGPCITGMIDQREGPLDQGIVIQEGSLPSPLRHLLPVLGFVFNGLVGQDTDRGWRDKMREVWRILLSLARGAYHGALKHTQVFLAMGHDGSGGRLELVEDRVRVVWKNVNSHPVFKRIGDVLLKLTSATGGSYVRNPIASSLLGSNQITVHPLGGCCMGDNAGEGVVNHLGAVFASTEGSATHDGLLVCDGAIVPTSLGVNPLMTISALAERAMGHLIRDRGWEEDIAPAAIPLHNAEPAASADKRPVGLRFAERMTGYIGRGVSDDYEAGEAAGRANGWSLGFTIAVDIDDIDRFIADQDHEAVVVGTIQAPQLSPLPLQVTGGRFNQFLPDPSRVETKLMTYRLQLVRSDGQIFFFEGIKTIHDDPGADLWADTTTLQVTLYDGPDNKAPVFGKGVLRMTIADFVREMKTMKATNADGLAARLAAQLRFNRFFAGQLFESYGAFLRSDVRYDPAARRTRRRLNVNSPEFHEVKTVDGKRLVLTRYRGGDKGPVILVHGLGVSSEIFTVDTIEENLLEYLHKRGYDCWLFDFRASIRLPYAKQSWTGDDVARFDFPPAIQLVRQVAQVETVQMLVHCYGATTFFMSMLAGYITGVRSAVVSQIATDVIIPWWPQRLLAFMRFPTILSALGASLLDARASVRDAWYWRLTDKLAGVFGPVEREERNRSATSRRISLFYGQLYEQSQLNQPTLDALPEWFGTANLRAFRQLARIARRKVIVRANGPGFYMDQPLASLAIPMTFIHGAENACYLPESTKRTVSRLSEANGADLYERHVIPDHGHIDCIFGKNAAKIVYPLILEHLEKHAGVAKSADNQMPRMSRR